MNPTITISTREWEQAARNLQATSRRSVVDWLNGQMLRLLTWTIYDTVKASVAGITAKMNQKNSRGQRLAEVMLVAYFRKFGVWPVKGSTLSERVERLIKLKRQSSAMLRAGWLAASNHYRRIVYGKPPGARDIKRFGEMNPKLKGGARPAKMRLGLITAEAWNNAPGYQGKEKAWLGESNPEAALAIAEDGLRKAMARQTVDMIETLARRLKKDLKPYGAK